MEEKEKDSPVYIQRMNLNEEQVNAFIALGYTPWQVTSIPKTVKRSNVIVTEEVDLMYHFIRRASK